MAAAAEAAEAAANACCHCGAPDVVIDYMQRLRICVCEPCMRRHEKLISKSNANSMYLLSDADLHTVGFLEKLNPRHQRFAPMKQYLISQVEAVAVAKHGSLEALEAQKQHRMHGKLQQRIQKRQAAEQEETRQRKHNAQLQATLDKCAAAGDNQHPTRDDQGQDGFLERIDPATGKRRQRLASHLAEVEVEEL